ncbi:hypothetical protein KQH40_00420 [bacterium]|nr:hypothetical protein [bacterium]
MPKKLLFQIGFAFLLIGVVMGILMEVSPALAAYIGPDRTVTKTRTVIDDNTAFGSECRSGVWVKTYQCNGCLQSCADYLVANYPDATPPGKICNSSYEGTKVYYYTCQTHKDTYTVNYQPATISSSLSCSAGGGGWCRTNVSVLLAGSEGADACSAGYHLTTFEDSLGRIAGASGCTDSQIFTVTAQGTTSYEAWVHSSLGDTSLTTQTIKIDKTAPALSYSQPDTMTFQMSGSDTLSGVGHYEMRINGGAWQTGATHTLISGVNNIDYRVFDVAGNVTVKSTVITTDATPPEVLSASISPSAPDGNAGWYLSNPSVTVIASDSGSGIAFAGIVLDGADHSATSGYMISTNGIHTVQMKAVDNAGNERLEDPDKFSNTVKIDTVSPVVNTNISPSAVSGSWYDSTVTLDATGSTDANSGIDFIEIQVDGSGFIATASATLSEGKHSVIVRTHDIAGNITEKPYMVNVDTTAPTIDSNLSGTMGNNGWYVSPVTVTINAIDNFLSDSIVGYNLEGGEFVTGTSFSVGSNGLHTYTASIADPANHNASDTGGFKLDLTAPDFSYNLNQSPVTGNWYDAPVVIEVDSFTDTYSGPNELVLTAGNVYSLTPGDSPFFTDPLGEGSHTCSVVATDHAGNQTSISFTLNIDLYPPKLNPQVKGAQGPGGWYNDTVIANANATDSAGGTLQVSYSQDGGASVTGDTVVISGEGMHTVEFTATDVVNHTAFNDVSIGIDTSAPSVEISSHSNGEVVSQIITVSGAASDLVSGVYQVELSVAGGDWSTYGPDVLDIDPVTGIWSIDVDTRELGGGPVKFAARAQDKAGNYSSEASVTLLVNNKAPRLDIPDRIGSWETVVPVHTNGDRGPAVGAIATVSHPAYGAVSWTLRKADDWAVHWDGLFIKDGLKFWAPPGDYKITVQCWDQDGNKSSDTGIVWTPFDDVVLPPPNQLSPEEYAIIGLVTDLRNDFAVIDGVKYEITEESELADGIKVGGEVVGMAFDDGIAGNGPDVIVTLWPAYEVPITGVVEQLGDDQVLVNGETYKIVEESVLPEDLIVGHLVSGTGWVSGDVFPDVLELTIVATDPLPFSGVVSAITDSSITVTGVDYTINDATEIESESGIEEGDFVAGWYQDPEYMAISVAEEEPKVVYFEGVVSSVDEVQLTVGDVSYLIVAESSLPEEGILEKDKAIGSAYLYHDGSYELIEVSLVSGQVSGEAMRGGELVLLLAKDGFPYWMVCMPLLFVVFLTWFFFFRRYAGMIVRVDEEKRNITLRLNDDIDHPQEQTIPYHKRLDANVQLNRGKAVKGKYRFLRAYIMKEVE